MTSVGNRPTAVVAHQTWGRGGAEGAAMWIIETLARDFDVTVYTQGGFVLDELNALAGTTLPTSAVTLHPADVAPHLPIGALAAGAFIRSLSEVGAGFDLCVTASGVLPWGRPALHFMSSVEWNPRLAAQIDPGRKEQLRTRLSRWLVELSSGPAHDLSQDLFVANSTWLKRQCEPVCPGSIEVIHPVVPFVPDGAPWAEREEAVLVFGRISPEKRIEDAIRIVERARAFGFGGRLVIAGPDGTADYSAHIRDLAARHDWIEMLPSLVGEDKARLLGRMKFGLNTCRIEAFGISTGEMVASGIITLVPQNTGQSDIVSDPAQQFASVEDAAGCLIALSRSPELQTRLHTHAYEMRDTFAPDQFQKAVGRLTRKMADATNNIRLIKS